MIVIHYPYLRPLCSKQCLICACWSPMILFLRADLMRKPPVSDLAGRSNPLARLVQTGFTMFSEYCDNKLFFIYMYDPLISDLMTIKSNQFIGFARYVHVPSLISPSVLMIMRSRAIFAYIMSPVTFDLVTQISNQIINSARYIHDLRPHSHSLLDRSNCECVQTRGPGFDLQPKWVCFGGRVMEERKRLQYRNKNRE